MSVRELSLTTGRTPHAAERPRDRHAERLTPRVSAAGGDDPGIEAEPMHAPEVASVLDLHAAVHDDAQARLLGDRAALGADDVVLAPESIRADARGLARDLRDRVGGTEHVDD